MKFLKYLIWYLTSLYHFTDMPLLSGRNLMKSLRIVALAAFVVLSAAQANSIPTGDPVIRTGGGGGSVPITSPHFSILTPTGNSPKDSDCFLIQGGVSTRAPGCFFSNHIKTDEEDDATIHTKTDEEGGATIDALLFDVKADFSGALTCALRTALGGVSPYFTKCAIARSEDPSLEGGRPRRVVAFFGGPGIPFGNDFSMGFEGFNANTTFRGIAVGFQDLNANTTFRGTAVVPEPGTRAFFVSGFGALLVRRRLFAL